MKKTSVQIKSLYIVLFIISAVGFSYEFSKFVASNVNYLYGGDVAGARKENMPLRVEVRGRNTEITGDIANQLKKDSRFEVVLVSKTANTYPENLIIDLTNRVEEISNLENTVMIGSQKNMPVEEDPSEADALLIISK